MARDFSGGILKLRRAQRGTTVVDTSTAGQAPTRMSEVAVPGPSPDAGPLADSAGPLCRCPECEYDLQGLRAEQTACPECGTDISVIAMQVRAVLAAKRLRVARLAFVTSPAVAIVPAGVGIATIGEAAIVLWLILIAWVWGTAWWWIERETPAMNTWDRCAQPIAAAILAAIYFGCFWAIVASVVVMIGSAL